MNRNERKPVCRTADVPLDGVRQFEVAPGKAICVVHAGEQFYACQSSCPHEGIALCDGAFDEGVLTCLEHLWQWDLSKGGKAQGLAEKDLKMYPVTVEDGLVYVSDVST